MLRWGTLECRSGNGKGIFLRQLISRSCRDRIVASLAASSFGRLLWMLWTRFRVSLAIRRNARMCNGTAMLDGSNLARGAMPSG